MKTALELCVVVICAVTLMGCETISFGESPSSNANKVRIISRQQAGACRLISSVGGESSFPPEKDLYTVAFEHVRAKAAEQSANAVMVRSYQVQNGPTGARATMTADTYACPSVIVGGKI